MQCKEARLEVSKIIVGVPCFDSVHDSSLGLVSICGVFSGKRYPILARYRGACTSYHLSVVWRREKPLRPRDVWTRGVPAHRPGPGA